MANKELLFRIHQQMTNTIKKNKNLEKYFEYHRKHFPGIVKETYGPTTEEGKRQLEHKKATSRLTLDDLLTNYDFGGLAGN